MAKISQETAYTSEGEVYVEMFNPEGLENEFLSLKYEGFFTSGEIFDKYYQGSIFDMVGVPLRHLEERVSATEQMILKHKYFWDGDSLPLASQTFNQGGETVLNTYGRKYSFSKAMQNVWLALPCNVRGEALKLTYGSVDGLLCGGFGVQGLIHTSDGKLLTTTRGCNTNNNNGLKMSSFNEGASVVDVLNGKGDIYDVYLRGMAEELGILDSSGFKITVHSLIMDAKFYEWGLLAYVDATGSSLTSDILQGKLSTADDGWELTEPVFHDSTLETFKHLMANTEGWVSHGLMCVLFSGVKLFPQLEKEIREVFFHISMYRKC